MKKLLTMLGFAVRAGQIALGSEMAVALIRQGKAAAAVIDTGASENTRKRVTDACAYHHVPLMELSEGALGRAIGRAGCVAAAVRKGNVGQAMADILSKQAGSPSES